jgi:hypothetical protein
MEMGSYPLAHSNQTPNTAVLIVGVRVWAIMFILKRETTQTAS